MTIHKSNKKHVTPFYAFAFLERTGGSEEEGENLPVLRDEAWGDLFDRLIRHTSPKEARKVIDSYVLMGNIGDPPETNTHRSAIANYAVYSELDRCLRRRDRKRVVKLIRAFSGYPYHWECWRPGG